MFIITVIVLHIFSFPFLSHIYLKDQGLIAYCNVIFYYCWCLDTFEMDNKDGINGLLLCMIDTHTQQFTIICDPPSVGWGGGGSAERWYHWEAAVSTIRSSCTIPVSFYSSGRAI